MAGMLMKHLVKYINRVWKTSQTLLFSFSSSSSSYLDDTAR
jgi:hypothetical protein